MMKESEYEREISRDLHEINIWLSRICKMLERIHIENEVQHGLITTNEYIEKLKEMKNADDDISREMAVDTLPKSYEPKERSLIPDTRPTFEEAADAISKGLTMYENHKADKESEV